jgi:hypothetical protein
LPPLYLIKNNKHKLPQGAADTSRLLIFLFSGGAAVIYGTSSSKYREQKQSPQKVKIAFEAYTDYFSGSPGYTQKSAAHNFLSKNKIDAS